MSCDRRWLSSVVYVLGLTWSFGAGAVGCSNAIGEGEDDVEDVGGAQAALAFDPVVLRSGKRKPLVEGIVAAENQFFTSTGRLFVSGDKGIFEIVSGADGAYRSVSVHSGESCAFGGMVERAGTLYANCYDMTNSNSFIFAAVLTDAPKFRSIHKLSGTALANGMTSDGVNNLFVTSSFEGKIFRLQIAASDPLKVQTVSVFDPAAGLTPNGIKYLAGKLYWTAFTTVFAAEVRADGTSGPKRALGSAFTFFDDLYADADGLLIADFLNGSIVSSDLNGKVSGTTANGTFEGPSSVQLARGRLGLPQNALLVTERNGNRLSVLAP